MLIHRRLAGFALASAKNSHHFAPGTCFRPQNTARGERNSFFASCTCAKKSFRSVIPLARKQVFDRNTIVLDKTAHPPLHSRYIRYRSSRLGPGGPAAHGVTRLMLLGSPPDMVHGAPLRRAEPSSLLTAGRRHIDYPGAGIHPCCSGLQVTGHR